MSLVAGRVPSLREDLDALRAKDAVGRDLEHELAAAEHAQEDARAGRGGDRRGVERTGSEPAGTRLPAALRRRLRADQCPGSAGQLVGHLVEHRGYG